MQYLVFVTQQLTVFLTARLPYFQYRFDICVFNKTCFGICMVGRRDTFQVTAAKSKLLLGRLRPPVATNWLIHSQTPKYSENTSTFFLFREKVVLFEKVRNSCDTFLPQTSLQQSPLPVAISPGTFLSLFYICISFSLSSVFLFLHEICISFSLSSIFRSLLQLHFCHFSSNLSPGYKIYFSQFFPCIYTGCSRRGSIQWQSSG